MTREEREDVIQYLENLRLIQSDNFMKDGISKAIEALKQGFILDKIRAEIEELKNKIRKEHNYGADAVYGSHVIHGINAVLEIFDKYNAESEEEK